ncbi:MAG: hypothetical protein QM731_02720 [Chitinophagaceae bacterium]
MAISKNNNIMKDVSGKVGGLIVFKKRHGKTIVSNKPAEYKVKSEKRKAASERFRQAMLLAQSAMKDPVLRARYEEIAMANNRAAFNVALSEILKRESADGNRES